jgi:UDP-glucose 4-epimerase
MSSTVLVTGGFGYLGGRIAKAYAQSTRYRIRLGSRKRQAPPPWLPGVDTVAVDLLDLSSLGAAVENVQTIVHLAAVNENESITDPLRALRVNTFGTLQLLEAAIDAGVERFIYFSTAHVYGAPLAGHITERTLPRPVHPYAITHRAAEDWVLAAHDQKRITGLVVRLSNGFGAPMHRDVDRWTLLVNDLCRQAVQNRKLALRSSGVQERDFITLDDVGRAACHLAALPRETCDDGLFNLGGENSRSVWEMTQRVAQCCQDALAFRPEIVRPAPRPDETAPPLHYDITKLKRTGFELHGDANAEIRETLMLCNDERHVGGHGQARDGAFEPFRAISNPTND